MAIFTAIGAAIFGAGTFLAGLTAAGLEVAAGIALNLIAAKMSGQSGQDATQFGVQGTLQAGGDIERSFPWGLMATAGSLVYANEWGNVDQTPNAYHTQVICVSDLPVAGANAAGLTQLYVDGTLCTIDWTATPTTQGYPVTDYRKDGKDHLWIKFYDGTQTTADSFLTSKVSSTERPYTSTRVGTGCAYVIATALVNDGLFNGFPQYRFGLGPTKLYDISKDTSAGGSGTHRWADPSTWGGDGDYLPAVQMYNLLRGIRYAGVWLYGLQNTTAANLPSAHWIAQVAKCRATITGPDGDEATYRSGGEVGVNATIADTATTLLTACQGRLAETGGIYKLYVGAPDDAAFAFDDGTILSTETQSFTPFFGLADSVNGITAKYPDPSQGWNTTVAPPLYNSDYEAEDGNRRLLSDISLDFVPYAAQVQRLMKSALLEARRARRHTIVLPPEYWPIEPGDILSWTSSRNGYDGKLFRVDGIVDKANLDVIVDITEVDPSDYDWDQDTDFHQPAVGSIVGQRPAAQAVVGFAVAPATVFDTAGAGRKPTIQLTWDGDQPDVAYVLWQVRLTSSGVLAAAGQIQDVAAGDGILPAGPYVRDTDYQARIQYLPFSARDTLWSDWLDVHTPDVGDDVSDVSLAQLNQDLQNIVGLIVGSGSTSIASQLNAIKQRIAEQAAANVDEQSTNKQRTDALIVQSGDNAAAVVTEKTARVSADDALGSRIDEVEANVGDVLADSLMSIAAEAGLAGADATIALRARAAAGNTVATTGILLLAKADGHGGTTSQIALQTDTLYVVAPDGTVSTALTFDTATGTLVAARLLSSDSKFDINLTGKYIYIES